MKISMEQWWNDTDMGNRMIYKKCPSSTSSSINGHMDWRGSNSGLRDERLATKSLDHGTAFENKN